MKAVNAGKAAVCEREGNRRAQQRLWRVLRVIEGAAQLRTCARFEQRADAVACRQPAR